MLRTFAVRWARARHPRFATILGLDAALTALALGAAVMLRFNGYVPETFARSVRVAFPLLVAIRVGLAAATGLHRWSFRMPGILEAVRLAFATALGSIIFRVFLVGVLDLSLPRTIYFLEFFFSLSFMAVLRFAPRLAHGWVDERRHSGCGATRTLIVGAGGAADLLSRDLLRSHDDRYHLVGFVDDKPSKRGSSVNGKPVLGRIADLPRLIEKHRVKMVMLAIVHLPAERIREILDMCATSKTSFKIIPASFTYMDERISAAMLHDLSPEDLLPRDSIVFDYDEIRGLVAGRRALVTGAGGSIGGELCRQLTLHGVSQLVLVDMNENELYLRVRRLQEECPTLKLHAEVADIREPTRLARLGAKYRPELVFHAAAHKHVPLMEDAPEEAIKNNVFGTLNVARMAHDCGAERFVLISTDKAVNPTSVMGATKRIAELVVRDLARHSPTRMTAVRFGNVLGSAGSVVPIFKQQIERGGPVTVTHPECTRYFMTIPEAVGLVLLSGLGDYGDLCVLDMGEPIRIAELARNLITMAGYVPGEDIPITYTGLRPGEKLYEELLTEDEEQTRHIRDRILVASSPRPPADLGQQLQELRRVAEIGDRDAILRGLKRLVPTYRWTPAQPLAGPEVALNATNVVALHPRAA
jgi:FlaA1/EpsC-like NDP-sugar epimerase